MYCKIQSDGYYIILFIMFKHILLDEKHAT